MRSDHRYIVREAIRREQGEPVPRDGREYEQYDEEEPPRREAREYERREYREPQPPYREPGPVYSAREPRPAYSDREPEPYYTVRRERPAYSVREPEPYVRRETRSPYSSQGGGAAYAQRESTARRAMRERPPRRDEWRADDQDDDDSDEPAAPAWFAVTRATAFFVGCVTLINLLGEMRFPHFSAASWWIDLHFLPKPASRGVLGLSAVLLIAFAFFPRANSFMRRLGALCTLGLLGAAGWTVYRYYHAQAGQNLRDLPVPLALHVAALLIVVFPGQLTGWWERTNFFKDFLIGMVTLATCAATFPLAHFVCLGQLDDHSAADTAAVFAARSDAEKAADDKPRPNPLQTACQLYREGKIKKILLVGGSSESGSADETAQALRRAALADGVAEADLLTPPAAAASSNSRTALTEVAKFLDEQKLSHVLIVARSIEVPRIMLSFERAGLEAHSAPVQEDIRNPRMRPLLIRESAALWLCYLQPLR